LTRQLRLSHWAQDERFSFVVLRRGARPARGAAPHATPLGEAFGLAHEDNVAPEAADDVDDITADAEEAEEAEEVSSEPPPSAAAVSAAVAAAAAGWSRIVRPPRKRSGHVVLDLCTATGGLQRRVVAASHAAVLGPGSYRLARKARWGDNWPHPTVVRRTRIAEDGQWVTALEAAADGSVPADRTDALGERHLD
jgi:hypothetical protein